MARARGFPITLTCLSIALAAGSVAPALAAEGVTIRLRYVTVEDRIHPNPASSLSTERKIVVHLSDGGKVSEIYGRGPTRTYQEFSWDGRLGRSESGRVHWRVLNADALVRTRELAQDIQTIVVHVKGSTCDMTFSDRLKPGFSEVKNTRIDDGTVAYYTLERATENSCAIE